MAADEVEDRLQLGSSRGTPRLHNWASHEESGKFVEGPSASTHTNNGLTLRGILIGWHCAPPPWIRRPIKRRAA